MDPVGAFSQGQINAEPVFGANVGLPMQHMRRAVLSTKGDQALISAMTATLGGHSIDLYVSALGAVFCP